MPNDKPINLGPFMRVVGYSFSGGKLDFTPLGKVVPLPPLITPYAVPCGRPVWHFPVYGAVVGELSATAGTDKMLVCTVKLSQTIYKARVNLRFGSVTPARNRSIALYYWRSGGDNSDGDLLKPFDSYTGVVKSRAVNINSIVEDMTGNFSEVLAWFETTWELVVESNLVPAVSYQGLDLICETVRYSDLVGKLVLWPKNDMTALMEILPGPCWKPITGET